jgi:hypothetical protein
MMQLFGIKAVSILRLADTEPAAYFSAFEGMQTHKLRGNAQNPPRPLSKAEALPKATGKSAIVQQPSATRHKNERKVAVRKQNSSEVASRFQ